MLLGYRRDAIGDDGLAGHLAAAPGLDGKVGADDNQVLSKVSEPDVKARYEQQQISREQIREQARDNDSQVEQRQRPDGRGGRGGRG